MQIRHVCIFLYIGGGGAQSIACFNERNDTIFLPPARTLTATWCPTPLPLSTSSFASSRWTNDQSKNKTKKLKSYPDTVSGHLSSVGRGFDCLSGRWIKSDKANGSLHSGRFFFSKFSNIGSSYLSRVSADDKYSPFGRADPQDQVQGQLWQVHRECAWLPLRQIDSPTCLCWIKKNN